MATDLEAINRNMLDFYYFDDKTIVTVGAGGGQFLTYGRKAEKVWAIDNDKAAVDLLKKRLEEVDYGDVFTPVLTDFSDFFQPVDVVFFEFSLHEMDSPVDALNHALAMAPDVVVMDHMPDSLWAYLVSEEDKARLSWQAIHSYEVKEEKIHTAIHFFHDYQELYEKVKVQGEETIRRINRYMDDRNFPISFGYGLAWIKAKKKLMDSIHEPKEAK